MARFPQDQFDEIPADLKRVGAHRAPARRGRVVLAMGWVVLVALVLAGIGVFALSKFLPGFEVSLPGIGAPPTDSATIPPLEEAAPITDPAAVPDDVALSISVLNATEVEGLANVVGDLIADAGWPDPVRAAAASSDVTETVVYYHSAEYEGIARGLVELLGTGSVVLSDFFPGAPVTVVVGADFTA